MELDFDKYCVVDGSPTTVLPAPHRHSRVSNRKSGVKPKCRNDTPGHGGDFTKTDFNGYRSASCKDDRSRKSTWEVSEMQKRGSVYQSSKEVTQLKKTDAVLGRKKIEFSRGSVSALPFGIIDSLCSSDEDSSLMDQNRSSVVSFSRQSTVSVPESRIGLCHHYSSSRTIPRISVQQNVASLDRRDGQYKDHKCIRDIILTSESVDVPINGSRTSRERVPAGNLRKSLSAKLALPHAPAQSDSDALKTSSPKACLSPARTAFNPFVKWKSRRNPLNCVKETGSGTTYGYVGVNHNEIMSKPLPNSSSDKVHQKENSSQCVNIENCNSASLPSPARLCGILKVDNKHGVPFFEFSVKSLDDLYVGRSWKEKNGLTWAYTFHSLHPRRMSNGSEQGGKEHGKESRMVGQMLISAYLCKELTGDLCYYDSMATEFVFYDTSHLQSDSNRDKSSCSADVIEVPSVLDERFSSRPMAAAELNPELEVAAIILQVPYENRSCLKFKSHLEHADEVSNITSHAKMHVVIPSGNHSLPSTKSCGPSPLLDRWRLGGGCDCGGWDMSCPLYVFGNTSVEVVQGLPLVDFQHPVELFVQGKKDSSAYSFTAIADGEYAVNFHAQLSSLQAFSICVSILHSMETSTTAGHDRIKEMLQSDSLRVFADEEIKMLINSKKEGSQEVEEALPSFTLNPPFSPMSRV